MARRASQHPSRTYLTEHYQPDITVEELERLVARVRASIGELELEGKEVRYLHSTIVPSDESFLLIVEAALEQLVREAYARAGVRVDRISKTLEDDAAGVATQAEPKRTRPDERAD